ncbi:glycosyltransferase family 2 protein [Candidatus Electrothrix sp.]|uniref:glycosyltransferase family 2 protein n=1 Tax=Candidatus Electrothrix sp. TaxID=2170559 RepID=UPI004056E0CD
MNSPLLFLVFNRPGTTKRVFEAIRQVQPSRLYIAADGARPEKAGEDARVQEVRSIVTNIDWDCEVKTLFRDKNLGCKMAVSSAITWFFEHEEEGIILEDDCVPDPSFFPFCQELLEKYRYDTRIMMISGNNFQGGQKRTGESYYFSRFPHVWGWATWKRAWKYWDGDLGKWPAIKAKGYLTDIFGGDINVVQFWHGIFERMHNKEIDTWDFPWVFACLTQSGFTILPSTNLVSNIGFGDGATHTKNDKDSASCINQSKIEFPLKHPEIVIRDQIADKYTEANHFNIPTESILSLVRKLGVILINRILKKNC